MFNMTQQEKIEALNAVQVKGAFGFAAKTIRKANETSRITGKPTPAHLKEIMVFRIGTVGAGLDYEQLVNKQREREGKIKDFKAQGTYCHPVSKNMLVYKHHTKENYYLRVYPNVGNYVQGFLMLDGNGDEVSHADWIKIRDEYFAEKGENKSQDLNDPVVVLNFGLDKVEYLKHGEVIINEVKKEIAEYYRMAFNNRPAS